MIPETLWLNKSIESDDEVVGRIRGSIEDFISQRSPKPRTLFSLNLDGGKLGSFRVENERLQRLGIEVLESYGLNTEKYIDEDAVDSGGGKRIRVYPVLGSNIEFVRHSTHVMDEENQTTDISEMFVYRAKWEVRYNVDPNYLDNTHP